jgi:hypothetical protein
VIAFIHINLGKKMGLGLGFLNLRILLPFIGNLVMLSPILVSPMCCLKLTFITPNATLVSQNFWKWELA